MENKRVVIYTSTTCPYCEMAKDYFKTKGIEYEEKSTTEPENRKKLVSMGIRGVPAIFIGDQHVVGFDAAEIERLLAEPLAVPEETVTDQEIVPPGVEKIVSIAEPIDTEAREPAAEEVSAAEVSAAAQEPAAEEKEEIKEEISMKKYVCSVCGYVYDPAEGDVDNGIPAGTSFESLPEDWVCPLCGVGKDQFEAE